MSPYTNFLAPRSSLSGRIQIGHKSGFIIFIISSVNIKPTRHRFGFSLAWDWQNIEKIIVYCIQKKWQAARYHDFNSIIFAACNEQLFQLTHCPTVGSFAERCEQKFP